MAWNIGARVGSLRQTKGWTRAELARRTGLNPTHLWKIEQGHRARVEAETVRRLARALGCTTDYLLGMDEGDAEPPAYPWRALDHRVQPVAPETAQRLNAMIYPPGG